MYLGIVMLLPCLLLISRSENYNGAWVYRVLPIETPIPIFKGSIKAFMLKCIIPIECLVSLIFLVLCGPKVLLQILLILLNMILVCIIMINQSEKILPFSRDFNMITDNRTGLIMILFASCGGFAGLQLILDGVKYGIILNILVVLITITYLWRKTFKINWKDIN
jgi:hypothetical protein